LLPNNRLIDVIEKGSARSPFFVYIPFRVLKPVRTKNLICFNRGKMNFNCLYNIESISNKINLRNLMFIKHILLDPERNSNPVRNKSNSPKMKNPINLNYLIRRLLLSILWMAVIQIVPARNLPKEIETASFLSGGVKMENRFTPGNPELLSAVTCNISLLPLAVLPVQLSALLVRILPIPFTT